MTLSGDVYSFQRIADAQGIPVWRRNDGLEFEFIVFYASDVDELARLTVNVEAFVAENHDDGEPRPALPDAADIRPATPEQP